MTGLPKVDQGFLAPDGGAIGAVAPLVVESMVPLSRARAVALSCVAPLAAVEVPLALARGMTLSESPVAANALPPFDNAAMDGFAVRAGDVPPDGRLSRCLARPVCTGMPIPEGLNAVVPIERVSQDADVLDIRGPVLAGDHVRRAGEELASGAPVLPAGETLTPSALGLLAAAGMTAVRVVPRPRAAVIVTGDELAGEGEPLAPGKIRDSNSVLLRALLEDAGAVVLSVQRQPDRAESIERSLLRLQGAVDLVCTSGGASVGTRDYTVGALASVGRLRIRHLAIRPGRPTTMGVIGGLPVFALPGNPLAAVAGFEAIVRPVVRRLAGAPEVLRPTVRASAGTAMRRRDSLELLPVRLSHSDPPEASAVLRVGSAMLAGSALADGFALIPPGAGEVAAGELVDVEIWR